MTTPGNTSPDDSSTTVAPTEGGSFEDAPSIPTVDDATEDRPPRRRLTRSRTDQMIGGVAGGLAEYFDVDPTLVRIAFVVLALASAGTAVVFYIGAWIIVPEADEAAAQPGGTIASASRPRAASSPSGPWTGVLWGLILIAAGAWLLLWRLDISLPQWDVVASALLIVVGLLLVIEARRGLNGTLLAIAIVLTAALGVASVVNVSVGSGFGDRTVAITQASALDGDYSHAFGSMTIDLSGLEVAEGTTVLETNIAFGDLLLRLPEGVAYRVTGKVFFGSASLADREWNGIAVENLYETPDYAGASRRLDIEVSVAFGSARIR